jgi:hypothetical protein
VALGLPTNLTTIKIKKTIQTIETLITIRNLPIKINIMNRLVGSDFQELMEIKSTMAQNQIKKLPVLQRPTTAFKVQLLSSNPRIIKLHIKVAGICLISNRREGMQIHLSEG